MTGLLAFCGTGFPYWRRGSGRQCGLAQGGGRRPVGATWRGAQQVAAPAPRRQRQARAQRGDAVVRARRRRRAARPAAARRASAVGPAPAARPRAEALDRSDARVGRPSRGTRAQHRGSRRPPPHVARALAPGAPAPSRAARAPCTAACRRAARRRHGESATAAARGGRAVRGEVVRARGEPEVERACRRARPRSSRA